MQATIWSQTELINALRKLKCNRTIIIDIYKPTSRWNYWSYVLFLECYGLDIMNAKCVYVCMHEHTAVTPFMHDLDIVRKNVLIRHNSIMHACI